MNELPPGLLLFDAGIYIRYFRGEKYDSLVEDGQVFRRTILTAVVASELYAGTRSQGEKRALDTLCQAHDALGHYSAPSPALWAESGIMLRRGRARSGHMDFAHHFRDVLIALEASRATATLITENEKDFKRWKAILARSRKTLKIFGLD